MKWRVVLGLALVGLLAPSAAAWARGGGGCLESVPCTRWPASPWIVPNSSVAESRVTETSLAPLPLWAASREPWAADARVNANRKETIRLLTKFDSSHEVHLADNLKMQPGKCLYWSDESLARLANCQHVSERPGPWPYSHF